MAQFKWVGNHPQDLHNGQMLAVGEVVELSDDDVHNPHNESLINDGGLIPIDDSAEHEATLADRRVGRREGKAVQSRPQSEGEIADVKEGGTE